MVIICSRRGNEAQGNGGYSFQFEEEEEIWHKYYSSFHRILFVGDGDFSFSLCLALSFGSASNLVATSLDSYAALIRKYKGAKENVRKLKKLGAMVVHEVDATKMKLHPDIGMMKFDRIVYNFPHAGFKGKEDSIQLISKHRNLVNGFLHNARRMLRPNGEIHVNHKTTAPFSSWNLEQLASCNSLISLTPVEFKIEEFPGYSNKRGDGSRPDEKFPLGSCSTFRFVLPPYKKFPLGNSYPAPDPFPRQNHSFMNDYYESNSIRDSFGIARPPLFYSPGSVSSPPRHSLGIYSHHSFMNDDYESNSIHVSFRNAWPPSFHSPGIVSSPPRHSVGIYRPPSFHSPGIVSSPPLNSFGLYRPPLSHSPEIFRPPPRSFDFVPFERETYPSPRLGISMLPSFHSPPGFVKHPLSHSTRIDRPPPHSYDTLPFERVPFSSMHPTPPSPGPGMFSRMLEDNSNIPSHFNMLRENRRSFDGYRINVHEAVRLEFERHPYAADEEDPRRSFRGYPH